MPRQARKNEGYWNLVGVQGPRTSPHLLGCSRGVVCAARRLAAPAPSSGMGVPRKVYLQVASILARVLAANARRSDGASIKSLALAPAIVAKKATYALTCETLRYLPVLKEVVAATDLLKSTAKMQAELAYVLVYDLLFGQGLVSAGKAEQAVLARKSALRACLARLLVKRQVSSAKDLLCSQVAGSEMPRYARVNTLKTSVQDVIDDFNTSQANLTIRRDDLVPELLIFPPGTDLHDHYLVKSGSLILQGKASCLPAQALAPEPSWEVIDACAAPGNKTVHLAALMKGRGRIIACEKDRGRFKRLKCTVELAGASNVEARLQDFLDTDPASPDFARVQGLLLDPSCSGSGMSAQRQDHLLPSSGQGNLKEDMQRLENLGNFQEKALRHALSFPSVERVVYSTCSVHQRENEDVVAAVLSPSSDTSFKLVSAFPEWPHRGLPVFPGAHHLLRTDSERDKMDGFFVAVLARVASVDTNKLGTRQPATVRKKEQVSEAGTRDQCLNNAQKQSLFTQEDHGQSAQQDQKLQSKLRRRKLKRLRKKQKSECEAQKGHRVMQEPKQQCLATEGLQNYDKVQQVPGPT
eukprot:SM000373S13618  [mRNA]  locus=s373:46324:50619:- [translate_table: standard]